MAIAEGLRHGPLDGRTVHLCIDMQRLFAEDTPWHMPWVARILPQVTAIARRHPGQTIFTRFIPPERPSDMPGAWRRYYERWSEITRARLDPRLLELVPPLASLVPPAVVVDKQVYSAFAAPALIAALRRRQAKTLVISGGETDVCVLATVMSGIDRGFRIVLVGDALCSALDATHDALLLLYRRRFTEQIETAGTEEVLSAWAPDRD